jgi:hypothetical protein
MHSLMYSSIGPTGVRAIAEAIAANPSTALRNLYGVDLRTGLDVLGVPDELCDKSTNEILAHVQEARLAITEKTVKGGASNVVQTQKRGFRFRIKHL